ncbi:class D sortase [Salsuginibacillus kocurii]|uniref:class D sortase n=1 Tax=Salsuginibacillus kocurii TaxID=427078 RepID=UPI00035DE2B8|nr:class D sortase [Salsuginibacillus kocurii]
MKNKFAIIVLAAGISIAGFSGWQWLGGSSGVVEDSEAARSVSDDWDDNEEQEMYSTKELDKLLAEEQAEEETGYEEPEEDPYEKEYTYEQGEEMAELVVPALDQIYPVYWGTDDATLEQGVGNHVSEYTTPPDGMRHTVLSGHRDTVFSEMGELDIGDRLYVNYDGQTYEYQIRDIWITDADDRSVIVKKDDPTLTLTTCYPFSYIGPAPERYIMEAELIDVSEKNDQTA